MALGSFPVLWIRKNKVNDHHRRGLERLHIFLRNKMLSHTYDLSSINFYLNLFCPRRVLPFLPSTYIPMYLCQIVTMHAYFLPNILILRYTKLGSFYISRYTAFLPALKTTLFIRKKNILYFTRSYMHTYVEP
jgi:hypothetical protein